MPSKDLAANAPCNFAAALKRSRKNLGKYKTTKNYLQILYNKPLPEDLVGYDALFFQDREGVKYEIVTNSGCQ